MIFLLKALCVRILCRRRITIIADVLLFAVPLRLVGVCCNAICYVDHWLLDSLDETGAWPVEILDKKNHGGH